ncbi:MAG: ATP-binding protein [Chloroflexota bacterium]|nr:ATP-binding protein [Chloroflexota bacterium]
MDTVGYVVGEVRTDEFTFVTNREIAPPRLEYIVVQVQEPTRKIDVLAQVTSLSVSSRLLDTSLSYTEVESILNRLKSSPPIVVGAAKVLGFLDEGAVRFPRHAATPGTNVTSAPDELLREFFSVNVASGIEIGTLINRPSVPVMLNPNGLRRHLAVIAQTGAGKSYTVGVILEKLLQLGGTVVVFDPNSDYVLMRRDAKHNATSFADRVDVFRLPTTQAGRIPDAEIGGSKKFTMQFSKLEVDEICQMTGIAPTSTNIRKAIQTVWDGLQGTDYTPKIFMQELERIADGADASSLDSRSGFAQHGAPAAGMPRGPRALNPSIGNEEEFERGFRARLAEKANVDFEDFGKPADEEPAPESHETKSKDARLPSLDAISGAQKALKYIERLERIDIWGFEDVPMRDLLKPMNLSVIDVAGVDQWVSEFVVSKVLNDTWGIAVNEGLPRPVFFVLEEAHNFVPGGQGAQSQAAGIIKRIASEGRKFGLFMVLITQRPYKVHGDTLSQCNSQIIMRLTNPQDQQAIRLSSESISEGLLADLPGLNVGEAVVLGPLVRVPVMVKVGARESKEGGNDIDVVGALERARSEAVTVKREEKSKEEKKARGRSEWKEAV